MLYLQLPLYAGFLWLVLASIFVTYRERSHMAFPDIEDIVETIIDEFLDKLTEEATTTMTPFPRFVRVCGILRSEADTNLVHFSEFSQARACVQQILEARPSKYLPRSPNSRIGTGFAPHRTALLLALSGKICENRHSQVHVHDGQTPRWRT